MFHHRFIADPDVNGRIRCFEEAGCALYGYIDLSEDDPLVTFELLGQPVDEQPMFLNDLVIGKYVECLAWYAARASPNGPSEPIDERHLIWSGWASPDATLFD